MKTLKPTAENFEKYTLRAEYGSRGGGIEIDLTPFGIDGEKMTAYQNYLGGGMLGRIDSSNTINAKHKFVELSLQQQIDAIALELKKYFHSLTNHSDDEWEDATFEENQKRMSSAY
jgi:hypothetical protein